jgi:hypothetical protein
MTIFQKWLLILGVGFLLLTGFIFYWVQVRPSIDNQKIRDIRADCANNAKIKTEQTYQVINQYTESDYDREYKLCLDSHGL